MTKQQKIIQTIQRQYNTISLNHKKLINEGYQNSKELKDKNLTYMKYITYSYNNLLSLLRKEEALSCYIEIKDTIDELNIGHTKLLTTKQAELNDIHDKNQKKANEYHNIISKLIFANDKLQNDSDIMQKNITKLTDKIKIQEQKNKKLQTEQIKNNTDITLLKYKIQELKAELKNNGDKSQHIKKAEDDFVLFSGLEHLTKPQGLRAKYIQQFVILIQTKMNNTFANSNLDDDYRVQLVNTSNASKFKLSIVLLKNQIHTPKPSGFEKSMMSISFLQSLHQIAQTTILSALILDEALSHHDNENLTKTIDFLHSNAHQTHLTFIISHQDILKSNLNSLLYIKRTKDKCYVSNTK